MTLPIISADRRLSEPRCAKIVLVGIPGAGKTSQLKTLPEDSTLFVDLEAGDLAVLDWYGDTLRPRSWPEFRDLVVFLAGPNPAAHFDAVCKRYGDPVQLRKARTSWTRSPCCPGCAWPGPRRNRRRSPSAPASRTRGVPTACSVPR
ncbi:conserved protein of unknown function (plasmid) [Ralstonia solanacearum PSI07]|nr:conserved protein of unknown function [Ralstonia solanacearum PSI07]